MPHLTRRRLLGASAILLGASGFPAFGADAYPSKPIKVIVPFAAGGGVDILARIVGNDLSGLLGEPVVIDDRAGAGGNIGVHAAAASDPDGYTVVMATTGTHSINPSLYKDLPYDPIKDFEPITGIASVPNLLVVNSTLPVRSVKELIDYAQSKPGTLNFGSFGIGTSNHLSGEMLKQMTGIDIVHVPYRKAPEAITDLISGQIQMLFVNTPLGLPHVKSGKLRALAVTSEKRSSIVPDLPTMSEAGVPNFVVESWYGLFAPVKTPEAIIGKLHDETIKVLKRQEIERAFAAQGAEPLPTTPEQLSSIIRAEIPKWKKIIEEAHVTVSY
jgi:tripartite-type tricarboxylate transporter receptor subunit TctC